MLKHGLRNTKNQLYLFNATQTPRSVENVWFYDMNDFFMYSSARTLSFDKQYGY